MASVAVLALSTAALAQVASSPVEQKTATDNVVASDKTEGLDTGTSANTVDNTAATGNTVAPARAPRRAPRPR